MLSVSIIVQDNKDNCSYILGLKNLNNICFWGKQNRSENLNIIIIIIKIKAQVTLFSYSYRKNSSLNSLFG